MMSETGRQARSKVLVALDGSPAAATALPLARTVAGQLGARLEVIHIATEGPPSSELWERLHRDLAGRESVQVRSRVGGAMEALLEAAAEPDAALLVLTTHGREVEPGRELGHLAQEVIAGTHDPILLVRPEAAASEAPAPFRRLLLPLDGTPTTAAAVQPALDLARRLGAAIDLLYVATTEEAPAEPGSLAAPRYVDQPQHEWPSWAAEFADRLRACLASPPEDLELRVFLAHGEIGPTIAQFGAEHHENGIILVRRSHLEPDRAPCLRAVLKLMSCPVLLLGGTPG